MPIYEFVCPKHGKFEVYAPKLFQAYGCIKLEADGLMCAKESPRVEFSVPARRNPKHGEQR